MVMTSTGPTNDIAILGGGLAGLSLAVQLVQRRVNARITIIDPRHTYEDDRTWCFWDTMDHPFREAISHRWHQWRIATTRTSTTVGSRRYPYCRLPGAAFYQRALAILDQADNVSLARGYQVESVSREGKRIRVITDGGPLSVDLAFDGRPPGPDDWATGRHPFFWQTFTGWRIRRSTSAWSTETVDLMDFRDRPAPDAIGFLYTLPLSADEALVESTAFVAATNGTEPDHTGHLRRALEQQLGVDGYEVLASESGRIPMTSAPPPRPTQDGIIPIGTRAGAPRPSSGYAFLPIQRHSQRLARALAIGRQPTAAVRRPIIRWLDGVFLRRLARNPAAAPELFHRLFEGTEPDRLVRFLTEGGGVADHLATMRSLPTTSFALEAITGPLRQPVGTR